jgi:PKD repeat protein
MVEKSLAENPEARIRFEKLQKFTRENREKGANDSLVIVPVVFHIIHNYGSENISRAQVLDALRIANEDLQKLNADTGQVSDLFRPIAGNTRIQLRLATKDPNGICTDGITRTVSALTSNADDNVKDLISWDTRKYLNVWLVRNISFGAGAYAYYPGTPPIPEYEGIVNRADQFGSIGLSPGGNFSARTFTHELGHYFNLAHTWGSTNQPGLQSNCLFDDDVEDTPLTIGNSGCNLNAESCGSIDNVENYMDYTSCSKMFTIGQSARMRTCMFSSIGGRSNLWDLDNLIATGTQDGASSSLCSPKADFNVNLRIACTNANIRMNGFVSQLSEDSIQSWTWIVPGSNQGTVFGKNADVSYPQPGTYPIKLVVRSRYGNDSISRSDFVRVASPQTVFDAPINEDFESTSFPGDPSVLTSWVVSGNGGSNWQRNALAGLGSSASLYLPIRNNNLNDTCIITSPALNLTTASRPLRLNFWLSHAPRLADARDLMRILISTNCGRTWVPRAARAANSVTQPLNTTPNGVGVTGNFVPNANQWRFETVMLDGYETVPSIRLRFEFVCRGGNALYIDDLYMGNYRPTSLSGQAQHGTFNAFVDENNLLNVETESLTSFGLFDLTGRRVATFSSSAFAKTTGNFWQLNQPLKQQNGIYLLKSESDLREVIKLQIW